MRGIGAAYRIKKCDQICKPVERERERERERGGGGREGNEDKRVKIARCKI